MLRTAITALALLVPTVTFAHDYQIGDLKIMHPVAKPTAASAMSGAGYLTIENTGDVADRLVAVAAEFPRVMIHDTVMDGDVARMEHLESIEIPPGATVVFQPGGMHVMFMGLGGDPFEVGEKIPATLTFEAAGDIEVTFNVEEIASEEADHSGH